MSLVPFDTLPDDARLWVFPADRPLDPAEREAVVRSVEEGLAGWTAHGSEVRWGHRIVHDQFLFVGVDERATALTGCSIDNGVRKIKELEQRTGIGFLDNARVFYRDGDAVRWAPRPRFRDLVGAGRVGPGTLVFDNTAATLGELRAGRWEVPFERSWHADVFGVGAR